MLGIVGFVRIIEHVGKKEYVNIQNNYIEFDSELLKDFNKYYFKYFYDKYNVAIDLENKINNSFNNIKNYLEDVKENKEKIKIEKKYIKSQIKNQINKIKKIDENLSKQINNYCEKIDDINSVEESVNLDDIKENIIKICKEKNINDKITSNLFKSVLSNSYFGQPSFLNVAKSGESFEELENIMYKDYICNIIEEDFLSRIFIDKLNNEIIINTINDKNENIFLTNDCKKVYSNIQRKYISKGKDYELIKNYIKNEVYTCCSMCGEDHPFNSNYTEANFIPLAISSDNIKNFFWNQKINLPICNICKLIMFCIPVGVSTISKIQKEDGIYKEKSIVNFINYDTDVESLIKINNNFRNNSNKNSKDNPYSQLILDIVEQQRNITNWQLENIFVIEFESEYQGYSRTKYFNIKRYVANFFKYYSYLLYEIQDYKYRLQLVDSMIKDRDFSKVITDRLFFYLKQNDKREENVYSAVKIRYILNLLKKGDDVMEDIKKANAKSYLMYKLGNEIHVKLKSEGNENKLDGYIYKMLNCIKTNNKKGFTDIAIRIIWSTGKDIPEILVKENENIDWQDLGHSFIAGLTSKGYIKNEKEENENENE